MRFWITLAVASAAGCAGDTPDTAEPTRGRLGLWGADAGDGAVVPDTFYDRRFGQHCRVVGASDGTLRCFLPGTSYRDFPLFADADCTEPAAPMQDSAFEFYYDRTTAPGCDSPRTQRAFRADGSIDIAYRRDGDRCVSERVEAVLLKPEPDDTFARVERRTVALTDRLDQVQEYTPEGVVLPRNLIDVVRGEICLPFLLGSEELCVPGHTGAAYHLDSTCGEESSFHFARDVCGPPLVGLEYVGCGEEIRYSEILSQVAPATVAYGLDRRGQCVAQNLGDGFSAYTTRPIGDPDSAFPKLRTVRVGEGRIQAVGYAVDRDVVRFGPNEFWDTELEISCRPEAVGEGFRCLPYAAAAGEYFADGRCETRRLVARTIARERPKYAHRDGVVYEVSDVEVSADELYVSFPECRPVGVGRVGEGCERFFEVGLEVDVSAFAEVRFGEIAAP